jgi:hypothetical protein
MKMKPISAEALFIDFHGDDMIKSLLRQAQHIALSFRCAKGVFYDGLSVSIYFGIFNAVFFVLFQSCGKLVAFYYALILGFSTQVFYGAVFTIFGFVLFYSVDSFMVPVAIAC